MGEEVKVDVAKIKRKSTDTLQTPKSSKHVAMDSTTLGQQQVEQLQIAFNLFDKDQNGAIDVSELQTVLKTLGQNINKEEAEAMMADVDINNDGEVDFNEFVQMMENRMFLPSNTLEYQDAFKFFDKNGDGYIDFNELKDVLLSLGEEFTDQDINDMLDEADTTGNGKVEFHEFLKMMPSNMQENYKKCQQKENQQSSPELIDGGTATKKKEESSTNVEDEDSASLISEDGKPTKR